MLQRSSTMVSASDTTSPAQVRHTKWEPCYHGQGHLDSVHGNFVATACRAQKAHPTRSLGIRKRTVIYTDLSS